MKLRIAKLLTLLLVVLLAPGGVVGQPGRHQGHQNRTGHRELKAYQEATIQPVLRQQRQKLELQLAAPDRAQLAAYRTQLQVLRQQRQAFRRSLVPAGAAPAGTRPVLTEAQRQQVQQQRSQTKTIMLAVTQLAQKYEPQIQQLAQEVQPQREKWAADMKAIIEKNATPEQREKMAARGGRKDGSGKARRYFKPAMFLLMNPNAPAARTEQSLGSTSFYPNPAAATSQLEFEVKKAGPVTVDLLDQNGTKLRTLLTEPKAEKGLRTQQLNLSDLPAGTYFYKITTKSGSETKRFVKE